MKRLGAVLAVLGLSVGLAAPSIALASNPWGECNHGATDNERTHGVIVLWSGDAEGTGLLGWDCDSTTGGSDADFGNGGGGFQLSDDNQAESMTIWPGGLYAPRYKWCFRLHQGTDYTGTDITYSVENGTELSKTINLSSSWDNTASSVDYWRTAWNAACLPHATP